MPVRSGSTARARTGELPGATVGSDVELAIHPPDQNDTLDTWKRVHVLKSRMTMGGELSETRPSEPPIYPGTVTDPAVGGVKGPYILLPGDYEFTTENYAPRLVARCAATVVKTDVFVETVAGACRTYSCRRRLLASPHAVMGWDTRRMLEALIRSNAVDKRWAEELIAGAGSLEQLENAAVGTADNRWRIPRMNGPSDR